jgi:hypothetical protein
MQILTFLIAAIGVLIVPALRPSSGAEDDDDVGLFIGSARPLPANPHAIKRVPRTPRPAPRTGLS